MKVEIDINDITVRDITAAIVNALAAKERTDAENYSTRSIFEKILDSLPEIISLIKEASAAQQPADPSDKAEGAVIEKHFIPKCVIRKLLWMFLKDSLTPEQLGTFGSWLTENEGKADEKAVTEDAAEKAGTEDAAKSASDKEE